MYCGMKVVVLDECRTQAEHFGFGTDIFGQSTFDEFVDAIAHQTGVFGEVVQRIPPLSQSMVASRTEVGYRIEERTVKVEDKEFFHRCQLSVFTIYPRTAISRLPAQLLHLSEGSVFGRIG